MLVRRRERRGSTGYLHVDRGTRADVENHSNALTSFDSTIIFHDRGRWDIDTVERPNIIFTYFFFNVRSN